MSEKEELPALLRAHEGETWRPRPPASEADVAAVEKQLGLKFPADYRRLLTYSDGGSLYGSGSRVIFFRLRDLLEFNPDLELSPDLADMLIFGDDEGDFIFYFDPAGTLGRGAWAVFMVEKAVSEFEASMFMAADLSAFCERVLGGPSIYDERRISPAARG